ncbi:MULTISPECIES: DLW-39 family protein [Miniimonas]|nr:MULTISPECIES: DLW-39 family protein [Miniimonas]
MKRLLVLAALAGLGYLVWREVSAEQAERDLWREVTDPVE